MCIVIGAKSRALYRSIKISSLYSNEPNNVNMVCFCQQL